MANVLGDDEIIKNVVLARFAIGWTEQEETAVINLDLNVPTTIPDIGNYSISAAIHATSGRAFVSREDTSQALAFELIVWSLKEQRIIHRRKDAHGAWLCVWRDWLVVGGRYRESIVIMDFNLKVVHETKITEWKSMSGTRCLHVADDILHVTSFGHLKDQCQLFMLEMSQGRPRLRPLTQVTCDWTMTNGLESHHGTDIVGVDFEEQVVTLRNDTKTALVPIADGGQNIGAWQLDPGCFWQTTGPHETCEYKLDQTQARFVRSGCVLPMSPLVMSPVPLVDKRVAELACRLIQMYTLLPDTLCRLVLSWL